MTNRYFVFFLFMLLEFFDLACVKTFKEFSNKQNTLSEDLISARNLGIAQYENEEHMSAIPHFKKAVELNPHSAADRINYAIVLLKANEFTEAQHVLEEARNLKAPYIHIPYLFGILHLRLNNFKQAIEEFSRVIQKDPFCAPAFYNLGVAYKKTNQLEQAQEAWKKTVQLNANHGPAYFQLFNVYNLLGDQDKTKYVFDEYQRTIQQGVGPGTSIPEVEDSVYFKILTETYEPRVERFSNIAVQFNNASESMGVDKIQGAFSLATDIDNDNDLDLLIGNSLYQNSQGHFDKVTRPTGLLQWPATCGEFGDFDNDNKLDLVLCQNNHLVLYKGNDDFTFKDITLKTKIRSTCSKGLIPTVVRWVDLDHEGDLDMILICSNPQDLTASGQVVVWRNNGNSTFLDISKSTHFEVKANSTTEIVLADFDAKNDMDVFFTNSQTFVSLFFNLRDGTFLEKAKPMGLHEAAFVKHSISADVNGDGLFDLIFVTHHNALEIWLNKNGQYFLKDERSAVLLQESWKTSINQVQVIDYDNDGDLDLFAITFQGDFLMLENNGLGFWTEVSQTLFPDKPFMKNVTQIFSADFDSDGDQDLLVVCKDPGLQIFKNKGGNSNYSINLRLRGLKNNKDGYGTKVWVRQGSFFLMRQIFDRWAQIGVGNQPQVDTIGLRWPTGVTQNQVNVKTNNDAFLEITERPGLAESCPFVYAFNGKKFEFITDVLDPTPLGVSLVPGVPYIANNRESILIESSQLKPNSKGFLKIQITQELEEITYLDSIELYVVDHPNNGKVVPNDRFSSPPFAAKQIHVISQPVQARTILDQHGNNVGLKLRETDRKYAFSVPAIDKRYPGITQPWELIIDPGDLSKAKKVGLFLRGTTLWTEASVNFAVAQNPEVNILPISLDVKDQKGNWVRVQEDLGVPAGMNKFLPIDLTNAFKSNHYEVRISSNMAILWDQAFFLVENEPQEKPTASFHTVKPLQANLHYRGFSQFYSPDNQLPDLYNYDHLLAIPIFGIAHVGKYTKYGDVTSLVQQSDDQYVILAPGDEITLDFPSLGLPPLPKDWTRDYVLEVTGYIKDADWRTLQGTTVEPLPFQHMTQYPYPSTEHYPTTGQYRQYLEEYQTRLLPEGIWLRM